MRFILQPAPARPEPASDGTATTGGRAMHAPRRGQSTTPDCITPKCTVPKCTVPKCVEGGSGPPEETAKKESEGDGTRTRGLQRDRLAL